MRIAYRCALSGAATAILGVAGLAASAPPAGAASSLNVLYSFCSQQGCSDGDQPYGGVTLLSKRELIGTTGFGGKYNGGTVFSLTDKKGTEKLRTLQSICAGTPPNCAKDEGPSTTLVEDKDGNIYGTEYFGGTSGDGSVFELKLKRGRYHLLTLYSFNGSDGDGTENLSYAGQQSGARYDGKSPLYGATIAGGTGGSGIVFSLTPSDGQWSFQTLYNFCSASNCSDGGLPEAGVTVDPSGVLYGTTEYYGAGNAGTIYQLTNSNGSWSQKVLYTFCSQTSCTDGNGSYAGLAEDSAGDLFGTTYFGGNANDGVVFELSASGQYSVLHSFCSESNCTDGSEPFAAVTLDKSGNIFGTTSRGGNGTNFGTMFEISSGTFQSIYSFCSLSGCSDGGYPYGTLAINAKGQVYGTTQYGGAHDLGEVYELTP